MSDPECTLKWTPAADWGFYLPRDGEDERGWEDAEPALRRALTRAAFRWYFQRWVPAEEGAAILERARAKPFRSVEELVDFIDREEVLLVLATGLKQE